MAGKRIFVAVAWPYANGPRHVGHVAGFGVPSDIYARYHRMAGDDVLMVSGTDEHGTPITVEASKQGLTPRQFADVNNKIIVEDLQRLGLSYDLFTRTTTKNHYATTQDVFLRLLEIGAITRATELGAFDATSGRALPDRYIEGTCPHCQYVGARGDQCDNCGRQLDPIDLVDPKSKVDGLPPVWKDSEHFYLGLPRFKGQLKSWIEASSHWRINVRRYSLNFVDEVRARAITRDIEWGIPIPLPEYGDASDKRIYVWFDAVIGYLSAAKEWATLTGDAEAWKQWWANAETDAAYFMGKDNIVFHTVIWPAMLLGYNEATSENLVLPTDVVSSEFLTMEGAKFSSSRGIVIYVRDVLDRYGPDALRYYLCASGPETSDADFTWADFVRRNNDELVANWGNLVSRTITLAHKICGGVAPSKEGRTPADEALLSSIEVAFNSVGVQIDNGQFKSALALVMRTSAEVNKYLTDEEPWKTVKTDPVAAQRVIGVVLDAVASLNVLFAPFIPHACARVQSLLGQSTVVPMPQISEVGVEIDDAHDVLTTDASNNLSWAPVAVEPDTKIGEPSPLFKKLDTSIIEEELARFGA